MLSSAFSACSAASCLLSSARTAASVTGRGETCTMKSHGFMRAGSLVDLPQMRSARNVEGLHLGEPRRAVASVFSIAVFLVGIVAAAWWLYRPAPYRRQRACVRGASYVTVRSDDGKSGSATVAGAVDGAATLRPAPGRGRLRRAWRRHRAPGAAAPAIRPRSPRARDRAPPRCRPDKCSDRLG